MSFRRQPAFDPADERFMLVRTMVAGCTPGVRTTSSTAGWHRLVASGEGVVIVKTSQGSWSAPASSAVWLPAGVHAELEMCVATQLRMLYLRQRLGAGLPRECCAAGVSPLLREVIARIAGLPALDRRVDWHGALARLLVEEIRAGARTPRELVWPRDERAARVAALIQTNPRDPRRLPELCRGQGVSARTVQRLFPEETGQTFEAWRARLRFLHATRLLADDMKVSDVATRCGYRSASAFVAAFRRTAGVTPGEYVGRGRGKG